MPRGLKETSGLIAISTFVNESAPNTFTTKQIDLQLDVLNQEVFIVYALDLDLTKPELIPGTNTETRMSLSTTSRGSVGGIADSNVMGASRQNIQSLAGEAVYSNYASDSVPHAQLEYIGIIATNDFSLNIKGAGQVGTAFGEARLWGVRARADAATFSALVQSELLSA